MAKHYVKTMLMYKVSQHPHSRPRGYSIDINVAILMVLIGTGGGVGECVWERNVMSSCL